MDTAMSSTKVRPNLATQQQLIYEVAIFDEEIHYLNHQKKPLISLAYVLFK